MSTTTAERTEKPTTRRLRRARREGQIARSQEVMVAAGLVAGLISLRAFGPTAVRTVIDHARTLFAAAGRVPLDGGIASLAGGMVTAGVAPFLAVGTAFGLIAGLGQVGFVLSPGAAKPKLSNLSWRRGLERFRPSVAAWDLARTALKLALFAAVAWEPVRATLLDLVGIRSLGRALSLTAELTWTLLLRAALLSVVIGAADYVFARRRISRGLRMTKDEVRREMKDQEGDPVVKARRRRRAVELSRNRIINVAAADVVVTNPTHYAVALAYRPPEPAPRVVAKGTDRMARRMRKTAHRHGVPVIEHRPLARSLYRRVKVGQFIPAALYEAAAVVLAEAYRRRPRRRAA